MLGIAVLGAGAIAAVHIDAFLEFPLDCEIRAVCNIHPEKAQALIAQKGLSGAQAFASLRDALEAGASIDAVSICLPPFLHCSAAVEALALGCHVLVEKPMANSLEECDCMLDAARKSGRLLGVVCQNRFKTPIYRVHKLLTEGTGGRVRRATVNSLWWRGENYYDLWWRGTWDGECGGAFTSHAVHHIDLLLWMMGMPETVMAYMKNVGHANSELEDVGVAVLEYPEALVQLTASLVDHGEGQELVFQTEKGRLRIPWQPDANRALPNGFPETDAAAIQTLDQAYYAIAPLAREGHGAQIENFLDAILGRAPLAATGEDGRNTIELIAAIYKSCATRSPVTLPIVKTDVFYQKGTLVARMPHFHQKVCNLDALASAPITLGRDMGA